MNPSDWDEEPEDEPKCSKTELALYIFKLQHHLTNEMYLALRALLQQSFFDPLALPARLSTLSRRVKSSLPLSSIQEHLVKRKSYKRGHGRSSAASGHSIHVNMDMAIQRVLQTPTVADEFHYGAAEEVDEKSELYHGDLWKESILAAISDYPILHNEGQPPPGCARFLKAC